MSSVADQYKPVMLADREEIELYWPKIKPLVSECIARSANNEMVEDDFLAGMLCGGIKCIVGTDDERNIRLAVFLNEEVYPQYKNLHICGLAGKNLLELGEAYWMIIVEWAQGQGYRNISASVSPAMERILKHLGFKRKSIEVNYELGDTHG